jgi:AcrR family transcriptional regulator
MTEPHKSIPPAQTVASTRATLIRVALVLFGSKGFDGTSTREIAAAANANIGSIAYHFGGKEGLRIAAADYVADLIRVTTEQAMNASAQPAASASRGPEAARAQLATTLERMVTFIVASPEAGEVVQFVLRELSYPTAALDRIYDGVFEPVHRRLCEIWEQATGEPAESEAVKIRMFMMIGQVVYFRIAREAVFRRMAWTDIGPEQAKTIASIAVDNLSAILVSRKGKKP